jgi:hypothetical protein
MSPLHEPTTEPSRFEKLLREIVVDETGGSEPDKRVVEQIREILCAYGLDVGD